MIWEVGAMKEILLNREPLEKIAQRMKQQFAQSYPERAPFSARIEEDAELGGFRLICSSRWFGMQRETVVDAELFASTDYRELEKLAEDPLSCVALGTGRALDEFDAIRETYILSGTE